MLEIYQRELQRTGRIVAAVEPDRLGAATPCTRWDVRALLGHLVGATEMYGAGGLAPGATFEPAYVGTDVAGAYDRAAKAAWETMSAPGAMERTFRLPPGELPGGVALGIALTEAVVHGWDLATATGQPVTVDAATAEQTLGFLRQIMAPEFRAGPEPYFAAEVVVASDAPAGERLVAFLGRRP